ncbi:MAG: outer membrane beta-barrel protein [Acidobacteria bacterium]|nr:outer membrane beta-barrel protein [Acidobacteriota bacterium]
MKKLLLSAVLLLTLSALAAAQDTPAVEIFGGYSFVRLTDTGPSNDASTNLNGWDASIVFNANQWAGFVADIGGYYTTDFDADLKTHSIMFGPKFAMRKGAVTPFAQVLFGVAMARANDSESGVEYLNENDFAMALGGGIDINVAPAIAIRPAQVEYLGIRSEETGDFKNSFRYSAGIVFKLGAR